jgi:SAM-dependent methyltransferase
MTATRPGSPCVACRSVSWRALGQKGGWGWSACRTCRTLQAHREDATYDGVALYAGGYDVEEPVPAFVARSLASVVASASPHRQTGRWLDIGFGQGDLLSSAAAQGWTCHGTELAKASLQRATARGWTVSDRPEHDPRFGPGLFDVVSAVEVVEHVLDPDALFARVREWLRAGGRLYLTTPNATSLNARVLGLDWSVVAPPDHLRLWSVRGLAAALARRDLHVERVATLGLNPSELWRRVASRGAGGDVHRDREARALGEVMASRPALQLIKRILNAGLRATGWGDTIKLWAVKR